MPASASTNNGGLSVHESQESAVILIDLDMKEKQDAVFFVFYGKL